MKNRLQKLLRVKKLLKIHPSSYTCLISLLSLLLVPIQPKTPRVEPISRTGHKNDMLNLSITLNILQSLNCLNKNRYKY